MLTTTFRQTTQYRGIFLLGLGLLVALGAFGETAPIEIATIEELQRIGNDPDYPLDGHYVLTQDIDASATATWNEGAGFEPIGERNNRFSGVFDGQGYVITDLFIERPDERSVGLFGEVHTSCFWGQDPPPKILQTGIIRNLGLEGGMVTGRNEVGGLVGYIVGEVTECHAAVTVSGELSNIGGLVGEIAYGTISKSYVMGSVTGKHNNVGGLVGSGNSLISDSYATGTVSGVSGVGGLIGSNRGFHASVAKVSRCYATGVVTGSRYSTGGLVGSNGGSVSESYATGTVTGVDGVGGLVGGGGTVSRSYATGEVSGLLRVGGLMGGGETVSESYATGAVTGEGYVGGLVGYITGTISDCFAIGAVTGQEARMPHSGAGHIGGLVGENDGAVLRCYATGVVTGQESTVGGLIGLNRGVVSDSYATGAVTGESGVGGLIGGSTQNGAVNNCFSTGAVTGEGVVGGLIGGSAGTVHECYATGAVTGTGGVGGLVGVISFGWGGWVPSVSKSFSTGSVTGDLHVGGLVGNNLGTIAQSYAKGAVAGGERVGGLVGANAVLVSECYATGAVTGDSYVGGLVGLNESETIEGLKEGTVETSFWDTETSGRMLSDGGTGLSTDDMKILSIFTDADWDFEHTWGMDDENSYPYLQAFDGSEMVVVPDVSGMAKAEAEEILANSGLIIGTVTSKYHETIPKGFIVFQGLAGGAEVVTETAVNVVVSGGPRFAGSLWVIIEPQEAIDDGAMWRLTGTNAWRNSGDHEPVLAVGVYEIEFKAISGWTRPVSTSVAISDGETSEVAGVYAVVQYMLNYSADANGTISGEASQFVPHGRSGSEVIAVPHEGYRFTQWSDGVTDNPRQDTNVTADLSVTAEFAINEYTLSYVTGENGSLEGDVEQTVEHGASGTTVTAIPDEGYHFTQWSDGVTENPRTDTNVTEDISVTASFVMTTGMLQVFIEPQDAIVQGAIWRLVNMQSWFDSGALIERPIGEYEVEFRDVDGWRTPDVQTVLVESDQTTTFTGLYEEITTDTGGLRVDFVPLEVADEGARWRRVGVDAWNESTDTEWDLPPGTYQIEFADVSGWNTPNRQTVTVQTGKVAIARVICSKMQEGFGSLRIILLPEGVCQAGAQWRRTGTERWHTCHWIEAYVPEGQYEVEFSLVHGFTVPPVMSINVIEGETVRYTSVYDTATYTLIYDTSPNGSLEGDVEQTVEHGASGTAVTAIADEGYLFTQWSDGVTDNPRTDTSVTEDISVTASFAVNAGSLQVILEPEEAVNAGAYWRRKNTIVWRASGETEDDIPVGVYEVEFRSIASWATPEVQEVTLEADETATIVATYVQKGSLEVTIEPPAVVDAGAQWRRVGTATWRDSGATETNVSADDHEVEFKDIDGWITPGNITVSAPAGETGRGSGTYTLVSTPDPDPDPDPDPSPGMGCGGAKMADLLGVDTTSAPAVFEPALPATRIDENTRLAAMDATLAVRLRAEEAIEPETVWGVASWSDGHSEDVYFVSAQDDTDGWAVFTPETPWIAGDKMTFTAGAETVSGAPVGPETFTFIVSEEMSAEEVTLTAAHAHPDGVGQAWQIGPDALFEESVTVHIPVPHGYDAAALEVGYHFVSDTDAQLISAERVDGWLAPDSVHVVTDDAGAWIELTVRHGGIVQLKQRTATNAPAGLSTSIPQGDLLVLLAMTGIIALAAAYRRRALRN